MGWSFNTIDYGRKAFIESLTGERHFAEGYKPLAHRVVGNHVWQVVEELATGSKFIHLDMIAKERNGGWGYKGMSETSGPYKYDCPLSLLDMCTEPRNDYAAGWREQVRKFHAEKAARPALVPGLRFHMCVNGVESVCEITGDYSTRSKTIRLVKDSQMVGSTYRITNARIFECLDAYGIAK